MKNNINLHKVISFAFKKHAGQTRPNIKKEPKTVHISEVANWVKKAGGSNLAIAAAYLHDTLEDTDTTMEEIINMFNIDLAILVNELTDPLEFLDMPLTIRKQKQAEKIKNAQQDTKLVKIADQISNIHSIYIDPPLDWDKKKCLEYIVGAKKIVDVCKNCNEYLEENFMKIYNLAIEKYTL